MSIPPLVCSTPPPPDQCEEEKEHDEFGLQYSLSQDDEDDDNFCSYVLQSSNVPTTPHHHTNVIHSPQKPDSPRLPVPDQLNSVVQNISKCEKEVVTIIDSPSKTKIDEDNNIEDLDLKFESSKTINDDISKTSNTESNVNIESTDIVTNLTSNDEKNIHGNNVNNSPSFDNKTEGKSEGITQNVEAFQDSRLDVTRTVDEIARNLSNEKADKDDLNKNILVRTEFNLEEEVLADLNLQQSPDSAKIKINDEQFEDTKSIEDVMPQQTNVENILQEPYETLNNSVTNITQEPCDAVNTSEADDFNDFDTFQFSSSTTAFKENIFETNHDPWKNEETSDDFGEFQANFEDHSVPIDKEPAFILSPQALFESSEIEPQTNTTDNDDDEFGDFDDFHSVEPSTTTQTELSKESNGLFHLKSTDNESQIYESIDKVICSLYDKHIGEDEEKFDGSLESSLHETWGYLTETEVRQPYMVNWNNSIGQKTLLKSLCIDSRNILFGPKWNNMPRYAANLSTAPLQPVKQIQTTTTAMIQNSTDANKPTALRPIDTWTDSMGRQGQEFTYAEALLQDLEHLMATLDKMAHTQSSLKISELLSHACNDTETPSNSTKLQDFDGQQPQQFKEVSNQIIYSNTINLQPLRQINLPDTHIFTPTDSEVPRSKTIHHGNTHQEYNHRQHEIFNSTPKIEPTEEFDNDFDDFQDFRNSTTAAVEPPVEKTEICKELPRSDATYQTQTILEPIKLEPTIPTLNWPEPGEVKETFDDFTDFVSSSSFSAVIQNVDHSDLQKNIIHPAHTMQNKSLHTDSFKTPDQNILPSNTTLNLQNQSTFSIHNTTQPTPAFNTLNHSSAGTFASKAPIIFPVPAQTMTNTDDDFDAFQFVPPQSIKLTQEPQPQPKPSSLPINGLLTPMVPLKPIAAPLRNTSQVLQTTSSDRSIESQDRLNSQQILQPLSLESFSQINWPSPGVDLSDLSRFNPINAVHSLQSSHSAGNSKFSSPAHSNKSQSADDDGWGDFVSIKPAGSVNHQVKSVIDDSDDWTDFVSSTSKPNGVNTISFNVHTNFAAQKSMRGQESRGDIPTLNYITPKTNRSMRDSNFQNL